MAIHVDFVNLQDMMEFAAALLGQTIHTGEPQVKPPAVAPTVPIQQPAPVTTTITAPSHQPAPAAPAAPQPTPAAPAPVPTSTASYTLDDIASAAMTIMDSGRQADLIGLLQSFGVDTLPALPQAQYGAFATALRGMGAQI